MNQAALKAALVPGVLAFLAITAVSFVDIKSRSGQIAAGAIAGVLGVAAATALK